MCTVKYFNTQGFFQLSYLHTERRLGDKTGIRCFCKMTMGVDGQYIFQLGECHLNQFILSEYKFNQLYQLNLKLIFGCLSKLKSHFMSEEKKLTTASGIPYYYYEDTLSAGPRGPLLLQDFILHEKMAHFDRERIPERVVHAKGSAAYGTFTVTHDITRFTKAKIFSAIGKETRALLRFSTVGGEKGSADTERDPRGFALKFYTEDGNWDLVGNNTPIFFIKDPKKFGDFIHTQKRDPYTNCKSPAMMWDFWSLNPESLHQVMFLMSDRGTPYGYRHMHGFGSHTFSMINAKNERVWVKFHFKTAQGIRNFTNDEAVHMKGQDPDFAQRDLLEAIDRKEFPKWHMKIQVMTQEQAKNHPFNPFDLTKTWSQKEYPLIDVGVLEL